MSTVNIGPVSYRRAHGRFLLNSDPPTTMICDLSYLNSAYIPLRRKTGGSVANWFRTSAGLVRPILLAVLVSVATLHCSATPLCSQQASVIDFNRDVRPILSEHCFHCHGPDENSRATDLRLDRRESAFEDLGGYAAIVPGDPDSSELIRRITSDDSDERMPPEEIHKPLSSEQIETLTQWVQQGAVWQEFWAYQVPVKHPVPAVSNPKWGENFIDAFVRTGLESTEWEPAPEADTVTLIRRLYFDLIGLPPPPEVVRKYRDHLDEAAWRELVDDLLASPHFGERQAIYWLDLVRYADTVGYHGDQDHNIAPYRTWVIRSLNSNMPFDQFTREQLAGDLLADPTTDQLIASGYNRLLQTTHEGGLQPKEYRAIYAADRVRNVSAVWMAATLGCAQCHDHKYDPYTARDFYSMAAFFADIDDERHFKEGTNTLPTRRPPELLVIDEANRAALDQCQQELADKRKALREAEGRLKQLESDSSEQPPAAPSGQPRSDKPEATNTPEQTRQEIEALPQKIEALRQEIKKLEARAKQIESRGEWTMITQPLAQPRVTRILPRGNWLDESGPVVEPAVPEFLGALDTPGRRPNRLDLANWLVDPDSIAGPLTARVMANRIWYLLMGRGISNSLDDFGGQGSPPTHPELLDNLAIEFLDSGWDLKHLFRTIVTSRTYRQASTVPAEQWRQDPTNRWFARQGSFRLPAEIIRDQALAVGGLLRLEPIGGPSIKPYQPAGYYQHLNFPPRKYHADTDEKQWRRGVYVHWQRQFLHPTYRALDAPSREECTARRPASNTPLAALALLNDPTFVEAARGLAERTLSTADSSDAARLNWAFERVTSHLPDSIQQQALQGLLVASRTEFSRHPEAAEKLIGIGLDIPDPAHDAVELAAWTMVCRALLNLDESITRN